MGENDQDNETVKAYETTRTKDSQSVNRSFFLYKISRRYCLTDAYVRFIYDNVGEDISKCEQIANWSREALSGYNYSDITDEKTLRAYLLLTDMDIVKAQESIMKDNKWEKERKDKSSKWNDPQLDLEDISDASGD